MNTKILLASFVLVATALLNVGCAGRYAASRETWRHPGTIAQQRMRATVHDPYPDQDAGPKIDGGRPRDFQNPLAEPVRTRPFWDSWRR